MTTIHPIATTPANTAAMHPIAAFSPNGFPGSEWIVLLLLVILPAYLCYRRAKKSAMGQNFVLLSVLLGIFLGWIGFIIVLLLTRKTKTAA